jgi:hypothetical protein
MILFGRLAGLASLLLLLGCAGESNPVPAPPTQSIEPPTASIEPVVSEPPEPRPTQPTFRPPQPSFELGSNPPPESTPTPPPDTVREPDREVFANPPPVAIPDRPPLPEVPVARLQALGMRQFLGKHITFITDVSAERLPDDEGQRMVAVFDAAVPQWCRYLGIAVDDDWKIQAHQMADPAVFQALGLWRDDLPEIAFGYAQADAVWMREVEASTYYRRHLLLHEGVHAIMFSRLGTGGPPWYAEGMAELLASHRLEGERLALPIYPASGDELPGLGRIALVQSAVERGRFLTLSNVLALGPRSHQMLDAYGWSWALAEFLEHHPRYQRRFRALPQSLTQQGTDLSRQFLASLGADLLTLEHEWQDYVARIDSGWDFDRNALSLAPGEELPAGQSRTVSVDVARGWQSSTVRLAAGVEYALSAEGRFQVALDPETAQPWPCEPGGVTIRYVRGRPLGQLLGAIVPDTLPVGGKSPLVEPFVIGLGLRLTPSSEGTLYLLVNDEPRGLEDNQGRISLTIGPAVRDGSTETNP